MKTLKIAIGTTSEQKIGYVKEALSKLGVKAEILGAEVKSGVSEQPLTSEETKKGSINRAKEALGKNPNADFSLGIEVGYHLNSDGKYEIFCWASIADREGNIVSKESHRFLLPKFYQKVLSEKKHVHEHLKDYFKTDSDPVVRYIAEMLRGRKPFIKNAVEQALISYLRKEDF